MDTLITTNFNALLRCLNIVHVGKREIATLVKTLSSNIYYTMHQIESDDDNLDIIKKDTLKTIFVHEGKIQIEIDHNSQKEKIDLIEQEGIIITPDVEFKVNKCQCFAIVVQSLKDEKDIIEIVDSNGERLEKIINLYRIIKNPKIVNKPWGHEVWISWFKNHHVLKKIYMEEGHKCSLQYHEEKSETNLIVSGKANVLKDIKLNKGITQDEAINVFNEIKNVNELIVPMGPGDFWDNEVFEIHRVFSIDSYTAYEASTPQLDDVIRLKDDNNRISGFIKSEHQ